MKNRKGFTLTELIGVIVLLGIIALIAVPIINKTIKNSKEKAYNAQVAEIVSAAKKWGTVNNSNLPVLDNTSIKVKLNELVSNGYLEDDKILDPRNNKEMTSSCVRIKYIESTKEYKYSFEDVCKLDPPRFVDFDNIGIVIPRFSDYPYVISDISFTDWKEVVISESENLIFTFEAQAYDTGLFSTLSGDSTTMTFEDAESISLIENATLVKVTVTDELGQTDSVELQILREGCFVAGTKVLTEEGYRNIETLKVGDYVYSYNFETQKRELVKIIDTLTNLTTRLYQLSVGNQKIEVSADHIFYVENKGWIRVDEIELNDKVYTKSGLVPVDNIDINIFSNPVKIYTISVNKNNNFFVTFDDVLVHNKG